MNERLIELYLEGWKNGYWTGDNRGHMSFEAPEAWYKEVYALEEPLEDALYADIGVDSWNRKRDAPEYKSAENRWRKLKMSKLWQSLK